MNCKLCSKCGEVKPVSEFYRRSKSKDGFQSWCKKCFKTVNQTWIKEHREHHNKTCRQYNHNHGIYQPLGDNPNCGPYLGIHIAEHVLSRVYQSVERMPINHSGYDFICAHNKKIDVKSACKQCREQWAGQWHFNIRKNTTADYFLCIAFDDRRSLNPLHMWLLPGKLVNGYTGVGISESTLKKWERYELREKLEQVITCCNAMKSSAGSHSPEHQERAI